MNNAFLESFGRKAAVNEFSSWQNSLSRVKDLIEISETRNNFIALEYQVPYNQSRIDCLLFGKNEKNQDNILVIELKQWTNVTALEIEGNFVETYTGGRKKVVAHPSQQIKGYHNYLLDFIEEFEKEPSITLTSCSYCHNYSNKDISGLFNPIYRNILNEYPIYCREDTTELAGKIKLLLKSGKGSEVFNRFMQSRIRPSRRLLENVKAIINNEASFSLLNEQLVAKNLIWGKIRRGYAKGRKSVIIVKGGPGTGKSLIAVNILAEVAAKRKKVLLVSKSKPFRDGLQAWVGGGSVKNIFVSPYSLTPSRMDENGLDVLLIDEAHRIETANYYQRMRSIDRSEMPMAEQLIRSAKTTVFFIDDKQRVRYQEIGNSSTIKEAAKKFQASMDEVELLSQFRCMGSNDYLKWIESVLGYTTKKRILRKTEIFDFKIFNSPSELYIELGKKEAEKPNSARLVAGYCWPWSEPKPDGSLINDVKIGEFAMPWETKGDHAVGKYPAWFQWAYKPNGFQQVGCIYTAQGFEFDYIGVIIGPDLIFNSTTGTLTGDISMTRDPTLKRDPNNFETYIKNIYRVLLTRGMKGCYVYFTNKETEHFFKERME
ncbi:MAG: DUF2075 domain-containing protein [Bacteroidales bacterium]|nr:DUF2075 domain-containing protein [Bacteroidales bacterium]